MFDLHQWDAMQRDVVGELRRKVPGVVVHSFGAPLLTHMAAQIEFPPHVQVNVNDFKNLPHGAEIRIDNKVTIVLIPLSFESNLYNWLLLVRAAALVALATHVGMLAYIHATAHEVY